MSKDSEKTQKGQQKKKVTNDTKCFKQIQLENHFPAGISNFQLPLHSHLFSPKVHQTQWNQPGLCLALCKLIGSTGVLEFDLLHAGHTEYCQQGHELELKENQTKIQNGSYTATYKNVLREPTYKVYSVQPDVLSSHSFIVALLDVLGPAVEHSVVRSAAEFFSKIGLGVTLWTNADVCNLLRSFYCSACGKTLKRAHAALRIDEAKKVEAPPGIDLDGHNWT